jgi:hypothetical protein
VTDPSNTPAPEGNHGTPSTVITSGMPVYFNEAADAYERGLADGARREREAIIALASKLRATIPADHPKGAQASFADYLRQTGGTDAPA